MRLLLRGTVVMYLATIALREGRNRSAYSSFFVSLVFGLAQRVYCLLCENHLPDVLYSTITSCLAHGNRSACLIHCIYVCLILMNMLVVHFNRAHP